MLFFLLFLHSIGICDAADWVARVNGEPVYKEELLSDRPEDLERIILFRLAVQEAKKTGLDRKPETKREIDKALYRSFLETQMRDRKVAIDPSPAEVQGLYEKNPMVRLRYLMLPGEVPELGQQLFSQWQKGSDFKVLVLQNSKDESVKWGGDLDFRGKQSLPPLLYEAAQKLKKDEVGPPIAYQGATHLIQLIDKKEFTDAPATYLEYLRDELRAEKEKQFLSVVLRQLKQKSKIDVSQRAETKQGGTQ